MKIANKISLSFLITAIILTTVVMLIIYTVVENILGQAIHEHLMTSAQSRANHIETLLDENKQAVELLGTEAIFNKLLSTSKGTPGYNQKLNRVNRRIKGLLEVYQELFKVSLLDKKGIVITSTDEASIGSDKSADDVYLKGKESTFIKDLHISKTYGIPAMEIAVPVLLNGESIGVIIADHNMKELFQITLDRTGLGETGEIYLVNKDYYMISPSRFTEDVILKQKVETINVRNCFLHTDKKHVGRHKATTIFRDYRGINVLGTHNYIPMMQWALLAEINEKEAFAPLKQIGILLIAFLFFVPLVAWLMGFFASRMISKPINKLHEGTEIIGQGNLHYKVSTDSKDEVGQLSRAFDKMTENLRNTTASIDELNKEISNRKRTEEVLRESEERFRIITSSAHDGIIMMNNDGNIAYWNESVETMFGYTKEEALGRDLHAFVAPERFYEDYRKGFSGFRKTGKGAAVGKMVELVGLRKDGEEFPIELSLSGVKLKGLWNAIGIIRDITERNKAEKELKQAKEEAELANRAKSEFLANMSHEIRTPMNSVIGFTDMLLDTNLDNDQIDYASTIKRSGESLLSLINDILDFSKIEAGELDFEDTDFDPELLAYDICEQVRPKIGSKPIEIMCRIGDNIPSLVRGDPLRYRQVLTNLMGNAPKFTEKGEIELSLDIEEEKDNQIKLHAKIRDTGIGIPKEKLSDIFAAFQQADGSITRKYGGTGLGLAISKQISGLMGGEVWAESEVNKGSIFHFTAWLEKSEAKEAKRFTSVSLSGKKALIVDDNQTNLDILEHILEAIDINVVTLTKGKDVLPTLQKSLEDDKPFDVCILDIQIPEMSGYEVAREIRNFKSSIFNIQSSMRSIPLIAVSSLMERYAKRCEEVGFDGFLSKPIHREKIYQMLERILGEGKDEIDKDKTEKHKIVTQYTIREDRKHSVRILLAEDNPVNQKLAKIMLTKAGYQVEVANNGKEAVEMYTANPEDFDLIFMDVQMPKMDGLEATRKIRNPQSKIPNRDIPIVAMTAHAMKGDREMCLEAGMDDYITKPIKREIVFEILERWVFNKET